MVSKKVAPQPVYKGIHLKDQRPKAADAIQSEFNLSSVAARILSARGFDADDKLRLYINPTLKDGLPSPSGLMNLSPACELIAEMLRQGRSIAICSDFDVDGLSGAAQVYGLLTMLGADVHVFVPDRFVDGYGLNPQMVRSARDVGCELLICIDFGTKNSVELSLASTLGMKTIVIDHHHVGDTEVSADVFINPNQTGCGFADRILCASALAWYLLVGIKACFPPASKIDPRMFLDLACLGTICDMVPLVGANRVIARRGLELLGSSQRVGIQALKNVIGLHKTVNCYDVSFGIGPRLNAAGRMVHGSVVVKLLTTQDSSDAAKLARKLNELNGHRQEEEQAVKQMALARIEQQKELGAGIVVWQEDFHTGVVGIVAQRLVETYHRPAVVLGMNEEGVFKGSVRGIKGFSVVDALASVSEYLEKYGGHEGAGGLAVRREKVQAFAEAFIAQCERRLTAADRRPKVDADTEISLSDCDVSLVRELQKFAPFGVGNGSPVVLTDNLTVKSVQRLKGVHMKAVLSDGTRSIDGMLWRHADHPALYPGARVRAAYRPELNSYLGATSIQAVLQAVELIP